MKIVESGFKIDLHIHSIYSRGKDGAKVRYNTIDHVPDLVNKLTENGVQICSITDHDAFGFDIYLALKRYENYVNCSIIKVLPGVEFSVEFSTQSDKTVVHVIAIFDDSDQEKVASIASKLCDETGRIAYDRDMAFSEEKFLAILKAIDLDTILIAHQKNSLASRKPRKNDANSVGQQKFSEFIYTDYFEAYEFKNRNNEIFNKAFLFTRGMAEDLRFITGSDCHDWNIYPKETVNDTSEFRYTYVKCLPTFRGLVMAITDHRRIKTVNSFFNPTEIALDFIDIEIDGTKVKVPLSKGINVIIGDNSIGKSLLLHKLTGYCKKKNRLLKASIAKSYEKYLKDNKIRIDSAIDEADLFGFDMQGEIRCKFEEEKIKSDEFLKDYYPAAINPAPYRQIVEREINKIYHYLEEKFDLDRIEAGLGRFKIENFDGITAESLTFVGTVQRDNKKVQEYGDLSSEIISIVEKIKGISDNHLLDDEDKAFFLEIYKRFNEISLKYIDKKNYIMKENDRIGIYQAIIKNFKQRYQAAISDTQKKISTYNENYRSMIDTIIKLLLRRKINVKPEINIPKQIVEIQTNKVFEYEFNSRLFVTEISEEYIWSLFKDVLKKDKEIEILSVTQEELADALPYYEGTSAKALDVLMDRITERLNNDFRNKYSITQKGMDKTQELSSGFNAKIYFDLLSYEMERKGIYIIDQPEDNISQKSIRDYLLARFKIMGENRQVVIVSHNPQFIVNLDVDNVIYLGKKPNGFEVLSGALEYKDDQYNMLDIISNHIEGGLDTLKRRWKRYEKNSKISEI